MTAVSYGLCIFVFFFFFFFGFVFMISRRMVLEHKEWASEESFLSSKEELWKFCKDKLAVLFEKIRKNQQIISSS